MSARRETHLLDAYAYLMGGQRPRLILDALAAASLPPAAGSLICLSCHDPSASPLDPVFDAAGAVIGYICHACKQGKTLSMPTFRASVSLVPACTHCASVDGTAQVRELQPGYYSVGSFCDNCWAAASGARQPTNQPSQGAMRQHFFNAYSGVMPTIDPGVFVGSGTAEKIAELPHCGQCAHCCNGLIERCASYAPEAPSVYAYPDGPSVYSLPTTGEWFETHAAGTRFLRFALPEGEQVPCAIGDEGCLRWVGIGWARRTGLAEGYAHCEVCVQPWLALKGRAAR